MLVLIMLNLIHSLPPLGLLQDRITIINQLLLHISKTPQVTQEVHKKLQTVHTTETSQVRAYYPFKTTFQNYRHNYLHFKIRHCSINLLTIPKECNGHRLHPLIYIKHLELHSFHGLSVGFSDLFMHLHLFLIVLRCQQIQTDLTVPHMEISVMDFLLLDNIMQRLVDIIHLVPQDRETQQLDCVKVMVIQMENQLKKECL